jgi:hypothetical protein
MLDKVELIVIRESKEGGSKKDQPEEILRRFEISAVIRTNVDTEVLGASLREVVARRTAETTGRDATTANASEGRKEGE